MLGATSLKLRFCSLHLPRGCLDLHCRATSGASKPRGESTLSVQDVKASTKKQYGSSSNVAAGWMTNTLTCQRRLTVTAPAIVAMSVPWATLPPLRGHRATETADISIQCMRAAYEKTPKILDTAKLDREPSLTIRPAVISPTKR